MIGVRLYRRSGAPLQVRRRASLWTSLAAGVLLGLGAAVTLWFGPAAVDDLSVEAGPRRLEGEGSGYFDDPLIDKPYKEATNKYWIFIHIIVIAYMLLGLNTVCDLYFTGALDEMVNKWDIKPDVAGATFMAAGGSAPELFTSLIGAAITESDVGFGTIVGSAVFNVLFVIGLCGFAAQVPIKLTWWPLFRDCTYYIFGLCMLALFAKTDGSITLWESIVLFLGYLGYCILMYFNENLEERFVNVKKDLVTDLKPVTPVMPQPQQPVAIVADTGSTASTIGVPDEVNEHHGAPGGGSTSTSHHLLQPHEERHHIRKTQPHFERKSTPQSKGREPSKEQCKLEDFENQDTQHPAQVTPPVNVTPPEMPTAGGDDEEDEEDEGDDIDELLVAPEGGLQKAIWCACLPIYAALFYGIPKPTERCFMATFGVSLIWIAGFSFWLVYCVEVLGGILGIHIIVMGFTLLAAGTSIPDLVSSMAVARAGEGDMAVSSSIGSNIFDILVGLPVPWMIKILFIETIAKSNPGFVVRILSEYIVVYVIILIVMVFCVIASIHGLKWYLNKTLGVGMALLYAVFLIIVLSVEFSEPEALKF